MSDPSIFLIGPMGSGKSAVGRRLAQDLNREFRDSDDVIEQRTGVDIPFIFDKEGEPGFRKRECDIIDELTRETGIVLATGGGAILDAANRQCLASRGVVVYLHATVPEQLRRTRRGRRRPLLETDDREGTLASLMEIRDSLYREIAELIVETDGRRVPSVAREIREKLVSDIN